MDSIKNCGIHSLKKTEYPSDSACRKTSNPDISAVDRSLPSNLGNLSFQNEILTKKLTPAKQRPRVAPISVELSKSSFESQLLDKIKRRAEIVEKQINMAEKIPKSLSVKDKSSAHDLYCKSYTSPGGVNSDPKSSLSSSDPKNEIESNDYDLNRQDSDTPSLRLSKLSILGDSIILLTFQKFHKI